MSDPILYRDMLESISNQLQVLMSEIEYDHEDLYLAGILASMDISCDYVLSFVLPDEEDYAKGFLEPEH